MFRRLTLLSGVIFAATMAMPASAQIMLGGKPVTEEPPIAISPAIGTGAPVTAPSASIFPANADAADYKPVSIATAVFTGDTPAEAELAVRITDLIRADFASVGIFTAPDAASINPLLRRHQRPAAMGGLGRRQREGAAGRQGDPRR